MLQIFLWLFPGWFTGKPERLAYPIESSGRVCGQKYKDLDAQLVKYYYYYYLISIVLLLLSFHVTVFKVNNWYDVYVYFIFCLFSCVKLNFILDICFFDYVYLATGFWSFSAQCKNFLKISLWKLSNKATLICVITWYYVLLNLLVHNNVFYSTRIKTGLPHTQGSFDFFLKNQGSLKIF